MVFSKLFDRHHHHYNEDQDPEAQADYHQDEHEI